MKNSLFLIVCLLNLLSSFSVAQQINEEWIFSYEGVTGESATSSLVKVDNYGDVYICGQTYDSAGTHTYILKLNSLGDTIWSTTYLNSYPSNLYIDEFSNVYMLGMVNNVSLNTGIDYLVTKFDSSGSFEWSYLYDHDSLDDRPISITLDNAHNVYVTGSCETALVNKPEEIATVKLNSSGIEEWTTTYYNPMNGNAFNSFDTESSLIGVDNNGNVYVTGLIKGLWSFVTIKYDSNGNELWSSLYEGPQNPFTNNIPGILRFDDNDNIYVCGFMPNGSSSSSPKELITIKYSPLGDTLWTRKGHLAGSNMTFSSSSMDMIKLQNGNHQISAVNNNNNQQLSLITVEYDNMGNEVLFRSEIYEEYGLNGDIYAVKYDSNNNVYTTGYSYIWPGNFDETQFITTKANYNGIKEWSAVHNFDYGFDLSRDLAISHNGDVYITGYHHLQDWSFSTAHIIKFCGDCYSFIRGNVYHDLNGNCLKDPGEIGLEGFLLEAIPGPYYATSDSLGNYAFVLPQDTFEVRQISRQLWNYSCPTSGSYAGIALDSEYVSIGNDFGNQIADTCYHLWVDIASGMIRPCMQSYYTISYCNKGTDLVDSAYIEVDFDNFLIPNNSSLQWESQNGNSYTFFIGTLQAGECGSFSVLVDVDCNTIIGSTHCVEARIYPESDCFLPDPIWDHSSLEITGNCTGDSLVCFFIANTGDPIFGDMQGYSAYRIYENNILVDTASFQLSGGDTLSVCYPANGNTIRLEADQRPGHPGNSSPQESIELCGTPNSQLGEIISVPEDDIDDDVEIDCREITTSFDPNMKQVKPTGFTLNNYILNSDELEYRIDFQNTGTDTAFNIVILDTLSPFLSVPSVASGISSHPYSFRIYGQGILEWKFDNIYLPDSNINEAASHGFVKFKVRLNQNLPNGTIVENQAAIIFDFNEPIITNNTLNTIFDTTFSSLSIKEISSTSPGIITYPNPTRNYVKIDLGKFYKNVSIQVRTITGNTVSNSFYKEIKKLELDIDGTPGVYLIEVRTNEGSVILKVVKY